MKRFRNLNRESRVEDEGFASVGASTLKHKQNKEPMPKLKEENDTSEKKEMAETQLHFIKYAAEEILDYIDMGGEIEEWYQNKLSKVQSDVESLHSYIEGEKRRTGMVDEATGDAKFDKMMKRVTSKKEVTKQQKADTKQQARDAFGSMFGGGNPADKLSIRKQGVKEEVEQIDELSKGTLASYAKKATHDSRIKMGIGKDFERVGASYRKPENKASAKSLENKYKSDARKREAGVGKAIDRLAKEEVELDEAAKNKLMIGSKVTHPNHGKGKVVMHGRGGGSGTIVKFDNGKKVNVDYKQLKMVEEVEQIDELSKKTLGSYIKSATHDVAAKGAATRQFAIDSARKSSEQDYDGARKSMQKSDKTFSQSWKRRNNMAKAVDRLTKESDESLNEKNVPTSPEKWAQAKAQAKSKFDIWPSAYASGWASKKYKEMGGGWKSVSEAEERGTEPFLKTSRKTEIVKNIAKKKSKPDKFESEPILSSTVTRNQ